MTSHITPAQDTIRVLLAGPDTLYFSCDLEVSDAMRERLDAEKAEAQALKKAAHCPDWLGARVCPQGAKGGYAFLIETPDFSVKVLGKHIQYRPGIFIEMRSLALHTHRDGPAGACEAALAWVREKLFWDQPARVVREEIAFTAAKVSRADIHIDWQGGYAPSLENTKEELCAFIRPGQVKGALYFQGTHATGYQFGRSKMMARLYNKTIEVKETANDAYGALLTARNGEMYDPTQEVWRLEFQVQREGMKGFKLYAPPEETDDELEIERELAAEELQHIGSLPRFFARMDDLFQYLSGHWLRLVVPNDADQNHSRWPLHPTWAQLQAQFATVAHVAPLVDDQRQLVRGARYSGKSRILRRMEQGLVTSLEVEDASPASAALLVLQRWVEQIAEREMRRITAKCERYAEQGRAIPRWVWHGMDEGFRRVEQIEQRVQMLLGIFGAHGVLPLEFKPAHSVGDLLVQHLDDLEQEAGKKGGVQQLLADHFARVYKVHWGGHAMAGRVA
jgi:hypothetical protein